MVKSQEQGTGTNPSTVYFVPKGVDPSNDNAVKGEDYFDRLRDVIDHVSRRGASPLEKAVAEAFRYELPGESEPPETALRSTRRSVHAISTPIDLSWKDGGPTYPKSSSRVGTKYQVPSIPDAGSFCVEKSQQDPDLKYVRCLQLLN